MKFPPRVHRMIAPARSRRQQGGLRGDHLCALVARQSPVAAEAQLAAPRATPASITARARARACAQRPAIANAPCDRLAACAYCRRLFGRALQNELRVICLTAQALLRPRTERNLAVMKFPPRVRLRLRQAIKSNHHYDSLHKFE
jgi:hypothetical protein